MISGDDSASFELLVELVVKAKEKGLSVAVIGRFDDDDAPYVVATSDAVAIQAVRFGDSKPGEDE